MLVGRRPFQPKDPTAITGFALPITELIVRENGLGAIETIEKDSIG